MWWKQTNWIPVLVVMLGILARCGKGFLPSQKTSRADLPSALAKLINYFNLIDCMQSLNLFQILVTKLSQESMSFYLVPPVFIITRTPGANASAQCVAKAERLGIPQFHSLLVLWMRLRWTWWGVTFPFYFCPGDEYHFPSVSLLNIGSQYRVSVACVLACCFFKFAGLWCLVVLEISSLRIFLDIWSH